MLNGSSLLFTFEKGRFTGCKTSLYDINKAIENTDLKARLLEEIVLKQYDEFMLQFNKVLAER
jgi:hypothetical protein